MRQLRTRSIRQACVVGSRDTSIVTTQTQRLSDSSDETICPLSLHMAIELPVVLGHVGENTNQYQIIFYTWKRLLIPFGKLALQRSAAFE